MPIHRSVETTRISQEDFKPVAYEVMEHVYAIHTDFGRFFDERIYKRELADRLPGTDLELQVTVTYDTFSKPCFLDVLVQRRGLFEFKATDGIQPRHRSQAFNYLLLFDLAHGKIINTRPERVESEFVNCHQRLEDLRNPTIVWLTFTAGGLRASAESWEGALALDPGYAPAHAGLSLSESVAALLGYRSPAPAQPRAREGARRALGIDPGNLPFCRYQCIVAASPPAVSDMPAPGAVFKNKLFEPHHPLSCV